MSQTVTTRTFLWSEVVAQANAVDALETAGNPFPLETAPWVYESQVTLCAGVTHSTASSA